ncbi:MAG: hypothetical protein LBD77_06695, partial [Bifidobacteriaceae bacterium]|nr:hypothetical protein [Bifidobacteriaceae bacterium]
MNQSPFAGPAWGGQVSAGVRPPVPPGLDPAPRRFGAGGAPAAPPAAGGLMAGATDRPAPEDSAPGAGLTSPQAPPWPRHARGRARAAGAARIGRARRQARLVAAASLVLTTASGVGLAALAPGAAGAEAPAGLTDSAVTVEWASGVVTVGAGAIATQAEVEAAQPDHAALTS